jgi:predicted  nucleic acid-binding Zn-ribbon protein
LSSPKAYGRTRKEAQHAKKLEQRRERLREKFDKANFTRQLDALNEQLQMLKMPELMETATHEPPIG